MEKNEENIIKLLKKTNLVVYTYEVEMNFKHKTFWSSEYLNDLEDRLHFYNYYEEKDKFDLEQGIYCYRISPTKRRFTLVGKITEDEVIIY